MVIFIITKYTIERKKYKLLILTFYVEGLLTTRGQVVFLLNTFNKASLNKELIKIRRKKI